MASATRRETRRRRVHQRRLAVLEQAREALAAGRFDDEPTRRKLAEHLLRLEPWRAIRKASILDGLEQALQQVAHDEP